MSTRISSLSVTHRLDHIQSHGTFVALPEKLSHNPDLIAAAITRGAATVVLQKNDDMPVRLCSSGLQHGVRYILVGNARRALASRAAVAAKHPSDSLKVIGVSGEERVTVVPLLNQMMLEAGHRVACLEAQRHDGVPSGDFIQQFFAQCVAQGMTHVVVDLGDDRAALDDMYTVSFQHLVLTDCDATQSAVLHARQLLAQTGMHTAVHAQHSSLLDYLTDELPLHAQVAHPHDTDRFFEAGLAYQLEQKGHHQAVRVYDEHDNVSLLAAAITPDMVAPLVLAASVARQCGSSWAHVAHVAHQIAQNQ